VIDTGDLSDWRTDRSVAAASTFPLDPAIAADHSPVAPVRLRAPTRPLGLSVQHYPDVGITVVVVDGELDLLTAPLLKKCLRDQLVAGPAHLILDLESVRFPGASGLSGLLRARELVGASGSQLHVIDLADRPDVTRSNHGIPAPGWTALWCFARAATATALRSSAAPLGPRNHRTPIRPSNKTASSRMRVLRDAGGGVSSLVATFGAPRATVHRLGTQVSR
jgi:anti-sigma B factor antagonist